MKLSKRKKVKKEKGVKKRGKRVDKMRKMVSFKA